MIKIDYTKKEIENILFQQIEKIYNDDDFSLKSNIEFDLGFDSLDVVELIMYLESELLITIDDESEIVQNIKTGEDIIEFFLKNYTINKDVKE